MCAGEPGHELQKNSLLYKRSQFPPKGRLTSWDKGRGTSQRPYSHHQPTDHPGHHPDSLGDDPKRQPEGPSLRSWDKRPSGAAVHLSLGVGGDHHPPDSDPAVWGARRIRNHWTEGLAEEAALGPRREGAFLRPAESWRLSPTIPAAENRSFPRRGRRC